MKQPGGHRKNPAGTKWPRQRYEFDMLDWIAALFVILTPLLIIYRLVNP